MTTSTRLPENVGNGPAWIPTPVLVQMLTGGITCDLSGAIAIAEERLLKVTLKQKPAAQLRAALKVAGVARVRMSAHNRVGRDSKYGQRHAKRVFAAAGA